MKSWLLDQRLNQPQDSLKPKPNPEQALALFNTVKVERSEEAIGEKLEGSVHEVYGKKQSP